MWTHANVITKTKITFSKGRATEIIISLNKQLISKGNIVTYPWSLKKLFDFGIPRCNTMRCIANKDFTVIDSSL